jgi:hypothetical protein
MADWKDLWICKQPANFVKFVHESFLDSDGKPSAHRVGLFVSLFMMIEMSVGAQYLNKQVPDHQFDAWVNIVYALVIGTGASHFISKKYDDKP